MKIEKIILPISIVSASLIGGGFFYAAQTANEHSPGQRTSNESGGAIIDLELPSGSYDREKNPHTEKSRNLYGDKDCSDFGSWEEAQAFFEDEGGPEEDWHNLDKDGDGIACQSLKK